jgi:hypothetical protein
MRESLEKITPDEIALFRVIKQMRALNIRTDAAQAKYLKSWITNSVAADLDVNDLELRKRND